MNLKDKKKKLRLLKAKSNIEIRRKLKGNTLEFTKHFFKENHNRSFVTGSHHIEIANALDAVRRGEITRLMINIAPRYGKTELAVKNMILACLSENPSAKFIHLSYANDLALDNSEETRDIVESKRYQELYPNVKIKQDSNSKKKWYTTEGGGVYATSSGGQITGFGAGTVDLDEQDLDEYLSDIENSTELFSGAIIIDDPIKPDDAKSDVKRNRINDRFDTTISNRVNSRKTPIIVIMQRVHENDLCGYLLSKEPKKWTVLSIPAINENGEALWPFKHTIEELREMERVIPSVFLTQYMMQPIAPGGNKIKEVWFNIIKKAELPFNPDMVGADFFIDGAFTEKTQNDPSALMSCYFHKKDGNLYIFNSIGIRKELHELLKFFDPWAKENHKRQKSSVFIELKASGYPLKSMLRLPMWGGFNTIGLDKKMVALGKFNRVENSEPFLASGKVYLVHGSWNRPFIDECCAFPNGTNDDQVDNLTAAIDKYSNNIKKSGVSYQN